MKIGIIGITGRTGNILKELILSSENFSLSGGVSSKSSKEESENVIKNSDAIIDFSTPSATLEVLPLVSKHKKAFICGTTGFSVDYLEKMCSYGKNIPMLRADNFSVGIQLAGILLEKSASILKDFDFAIIEKHHKRKKDAPSGTALFLEKQAHRKAQIVSIRAGNIFGEHICEFVGENEILKISHSALNRKVFAEGALNCAYWLKNKTAGLYSVRDYLAEKIGI